MDKKSWPAARRVNYFWMVMGRCNYRCPYCVYGQVPMDRRKVGYYYGPEQWLTAWRRMYEKYGEGDIILTGGEPTLYPRFAELVEELSRMFWIAFDTNLSWSNEELDGFLGRVSPRRVRFETSFHPHCTETRPFLEKALLIRQRGFDFIHRLVAYPDLLGRIPRFREEFAQHGLTFVVNPFQGFYNGRQYPGAYSDAEKALIAGATVNIEGSRENVPHKEFVQQMLAGESPKGRLCRTGYQHVRIEDDGRVYRCVEYSGKDWEPLGHFINDELRLWDSPKLCRSDHCEWEYRFLVDQAERFQNA